MMDPGPSGAMILKSQLQEKLPAQQNKINE